MCAKYSGPTFCSSHENHKFVRSYFCYLLRKEAEAETSPSYETHPQYTEARFSHTDTRITLSQSCLPLSRENGHESLQLEHDLFFTNFGHLPSKHHLSHWFIFNYSPTKQQRQSPRSQLPPLPSLLYSLSLYCSTHPRSQRERGVPPHAATLS